MGVDAVAIFIFYFIRKWLLGLYCSGCWELDLEMYSQLCKTLLQ